MFCRCLYVYMSMWLYMCVTLTIPVRIHLCRKHHYNTFQLNFTLIRENMCFLLCIHPGPIKIQDIKEWFLKFLMVVTLIGIRRSVIHPWTLLSDKPSTTYMQNTNNLPIYKHFSWSCSGFSIGITAFNMKWWNPI